MSEKEKKREPESEREGDSKIIHQCQTNIGARCADDTHTNDCAAQT